MKKSRLGELDVLRGIAALVVVLYHYTTKAQELLHLSNTVSFTYGYLGVQLFFIISGFVIFMTIEKVGSLKEFIVRRFFRLYPVYWASVIITFSITYIAGIERLERTFFEAVVNFTMIQDLLLIRSVDGAYWSLLPELLFYVFIAILYKYGKLKSFRVYGIIWLLAHVIFHNINAPYIGAPIIIFNLNYGVFFFSGMLFYKMYTKPNESKFDMLLIILSFFTCFALDYSYTEMLIISIFYLIFYLFIKGKLRWIVNKYLVYIGIISYPLYLIHQFIGYVLIAKLGELNYWSTSVNILIAIIFSLGIASSLHYLIEVPIQNLSKKICKRIITGSILIKYN